MTKAKKKPAKKAAVVWRRARDGYWRLDAAGWTAQVEYTGNPVDIDSCMLTVDVHLGHSASVAGFTSPSAAKAAALELAKLVAKWGGKKR